MRAEPAPAAPKGPALPELSRQQCRVRSARADGRKGRTAVQQQLGEGSERWERTARRAEVGAGGAPGTRQRLPAARERPTEERAVPLQPMDVAAGAARAGAAARGEWPAVGRTAGGAAPVGTREERCLKGGPSSTEPCCGGAGRATQRVGRPCGISSEGQRCGRDPDAVTSE